MATNLGIPYMGSKRKLAPQLINIMAEHQPEAVNFVDLFGGGGAVSFTAEAMGYNVLYNELNPAIAALMEKLLTDHLPTSIFDWVDRATFHEKKIGTDWYAGFIQSVWSFGNRGDTYLYSEKNERMKKPLHDAAVHLDPEARAFIESEYNVDLGEDFANLDLRGRRLRITGQVKKMLKTGRLDLQHLEAVSRLESVERLNTLARITNKKPKNIEVSCLDYRNVTLPDDAIIYCDPPYQDRAKYMTGDFDHAAFFEWVKAQPQTIFVSSYSADLYPVASFKHGSRMQSGEQQVIENLYCNKKLDIVLPS